jgi:hypothetical protein
MKWSPAVYTSRISTPLPRSRTSRFLLIEGRLQPRGAGRLARMWTLRRVGGLETTSSALRGASRRFLFWRPPQFTYAPRIRRRGGAIRGGAPQAAWPNRLTDVYRLLQCESRQFPRASGRQGPNRRRLTSPIQQNTRLRYISILRRLLDSPRCASLVADDFSFSVSSSRSSGGTSGSATNFVC